MAHLWCECVVTCLRIKLVRMFSLLFVSSEVCLRTGTYTPQNHAFYLSKVEHKQHLYRNLKPYLTSLFIPLTYRPGENFLSTKYTREKFQFFQVLWASICYIIIISYKLTFGRVIMIIYILWWLEYSQRRLRIFIRCFWLCVIRTQTSMVLIMRSIWLVS